MSNVKVICHHGIKGQKWGVKNGPPYPLDAGDHSASEKKYMSKKKSSKSSKTSSGSKKSKKSSKNIDKNSEKSQNEDKKKRGLTDKQKKYIKIGAAVAATAIIAYGTYRMADSGELHRLTEKGKAKLRGDDGILFERNESLLEVNDLQDLINKAAAPVKLGSEHLMNCRRCTFTYELRRRGYDVVATDTIGGTGQHAGGFINAQRPKGKLLKTSIPGITYDVMMNNYTTEEFNTFTNHKLQGFKDSVIPRQHGLDKSSVSKTLFDSLATYPDGARGELEIIWNSKKDPTKATQGHSMAWEIFNGKPIIIDTQTRTMYEDAEAFTNRGHADRIWAAELNRLDDKELNYDFLLRWSKNRTSDENLRLVSNLQENLENWRD